MPARTVTLPGPIDAVRTLRRGSLFPDDPTTRRVGGAVWFAFHTPDGPASIAYRQTGERDVTAEAFGPGAGRALEGAPDHLGARDRPEDFAPDDPLLAPLARRFPGVRFGRTARVMERLVPTILGQKVTGEGASRSWRDLLRRTSEPAPGPLEGLWLPPRVERLRELAYFDFHPMGVERKRAQIILGAVRRARTMEKLAHADADAAWARLTAMPGIGPWTAAVVLGAARGDADLVPVGDYHIPNTVVHAFTGADRGTDEEMLELLAPFRPHRGRVITLLALGGHGAPRFGPRMPVRDIRGQ